MLSTTPSKLASPCNIDIILEICHGYVNRDDLVQPVAETTVGRARPQGAKMEACFLTASQAVSQIREGKLTSEALVRSCLRRIEQRDDAVRAWLCVDADYALRQARAFDNRPVVGPLHGLPIGVKDIMHTADMPTTYNSSLYEGYRPTKDAA